MSEDTTRAVVTELYAAYGRRDFGRVAELIDDDVDWIIYGPMQVFPLAGHRHGKARRVGSARRTLPRTMLLESYVPQGHDRGRRSGGGDVGRGLQAALDRPDLRFHIANFLRIRDGRLVEFREFANTFDLVEQALGHMLPV